VIVRLEATVRERVFEAVCCGVELSVTVTLTLKVPVLLAVPLNAPAALKLIPAGRPVALQV
jgi:hypothetical protein